MAAIASFRPRAPQPGAPLPPAAAGALLSGDALILRGVTRAFGAVRAVDDVSLTVAAGQKHAVIGSNGAGKTTLFNAITGDFPPSAGSIHFFGEDITALPPHERIRKGLRRTYQSSLLFRDLSVRDNLVPRGARRRQRPLLLSCPARARTASTLATQDLLERVRLSHIAESRCPAWRTASSGSWRSAWRWPVRRA
jgi:branched-chain amino acid transport system ATP-binding protein